MTVLKDTGWRAAPDRPKPSFDVFERAEQAGKYRPLREQALGPDSLDPQVASVRYTAAMAAKLGLYSPPIPEPQPERKKPKGKPKLSRHEQIVQRISSTAAEDDGYRVQLIDHAARQGGVYKESLDRVYEVEKQKLGRFEALARLVLDQRQLAETQRRDAQQGLDGEAQPADTQ
jgi:hypothetical protein